MISILLVNYNGLEHLEECLGSVFGQTYRKFEVILVDNGSCDGSAEYVERAFPQVKVIRSGANRGFAGGNNFGYPHCSGDFIYFLNNDTRMEPDALEELVKAAAARTDVRIFGSFLINYDNPELVCSAGDTIYVLGFVDTFYGCPVRNFTRPRLITSVCAGAALYSREVLERIGLFDEDFFLIFEDVDLALRAQHQGYRILFVPSSRVYHKDHATLGGAFSALSFYYLERNFPLIFIKNFPLPNLLLTLPALLVFKLLRFFDAWRRGMLAPYTRGNLGTLALIPAMIRKRREILAGSQLSARQFLGVLGKSWIMDRLAVKKGFYEIPR